jgi:hypothetical protein
MRHSIVTLVKFCLTFSVILPLSACMLSAQNDDNYATQNAQPSAMDGNKENREASSIEQIGSKPSKGNVATEQVAIVGSGTRSDNKDNIAIVQLPGNLEAISGTGPEGSIGADSVSPEVRLYEKVAQVWYTLRQRGIQPTPERIAEEIGPDQLARFLDQNPEAGNIFGKDSDTLPLPRPGDESSGGAIELIPPQNGGG